ncbi:helix-turn-helix domain-containing protein [Mycobacterium sp. 134]|uniref:helix-turn-helix domain-containing protein n=1 Tax=Mycobacterium sp. 134 TaxID=3400425 RepID=UPI003AACC53C
MTQVEIAVLAAMVRSRRNELGYTRPQCTAAGGPTTATLTAIEQGRLTHPAETVLAQLDTALQWPTGTAQSATTAPAATIGQPTMAPTTLAQHKLLYNELVNHHATQEAIDVAAAMLTPALRTQLRHRIERADTETLLAIERLLTARPTPAPTVARDKPHRRTKRPTPEITDDAGQTITLRDLRLNRGWSLDDAIGKITALQQIAGGHGTVSRGTLSAIETGLRGMSPQMAAQLEQIYQLTPHALAVYASRPGRPRTKRTTRHQPCPTP